MTRAGGKLRRLTRNGHDQAPASHLAAAPGAAFSHSLRLGARRQAAIRGNLTMKHPTPWLITHGHTLNRKATKTWQAWKDMKSRCLNPNHPSFKYYGGRGICVCKTWLNDFRNFLIDMGEAQPGLWLDRKNNNGPYCKDNCRWVTFKEQATNTRRAILVTLDGKTHSINGWSKILGISNSTISQAVRRSGKSHYFEIMKRLS